MELKGDLQSLIDRAWVLLDELTDEIKNITNSTFCNLCAENGRFCHFAETSFHERESLISVRDSLKQVGDVLIFLQRLRSWQLIDRHAALNRLEESRTIQKEKVKEYKGKSLDVVKELNAFDWNLNGKIKNKVQSNTEKSRRSTSRFIRMLFEPWKWQKGLMVALKFAVISASISSTVRLSQRKVGPNKDILIPSFSNSPPDVFYGRG